MKPVVATDDVWNETNVAAFEKKLEALRNHYHIPSLSVGIVNEKKNSLEKRIWLFRYRKQKTAG